MNTRTERHFRFGHNNCLRCGQRLVDFPPQKSTVICGHCENDDERKKGQIQRHFCQGLLYDDVCGEEFTPEFEGQKHCSECLPENQHHYEEDE